MAEAVQGIRVELGLRQAFPLSADWTDDPAAFFPGAAERALEGRV